MQSLSSSHDAFRGDKGVHLSSTRFNSRCFMFLTLAIATHQPCRPFLHMLEKRLELGTWKEISQLLWSSWGNVLRLENKKRNNKIVWDLPGLGLLSNKALQVGRKSHNHFFERAQSSPGETRNSPFRQNPRELFGWPAMFPLKVLPSL